MTREELDRDREWQTFVHAEIHWLCEPLVACHRRQRNRVLRALNTRPAPQDEARLLKAYGRKYDEYCDDLILILQTLCPTDYEMLN